MRCLTKMTNDSVAYIRCLASLHARNADWAEKAVREAVSLPYDAALEQHVIDLVAVDLPDLLAKVNGRSVIVRGKPVVLDTNGLAVVEVAPGLRAGLGMASASIRLISRDSQWPLCSRG